MPLSRPIPVPKPTPRVVERYRRRTDEAKALREAYADHPIQLTAAEAVE